MSTLACASTVYRVLVVDDNRAIHEDFRKVLAAEPERVRELRAGEALLFGTLAPLDEDAVFEVVSAHQGQEALAAVEQALGEGRPFAVAFVDVRMPPGWDGIETIERLWRADPALQVAICTAYSDYSWSDISARFGACDNLLVLKKPFDAIEVLQMAHALSCKWRLAAVARARLGEMERQVELRTAELRAELTARTQAQEAFRTVFETSPVAIGLADETGRFREGNGAFAALLGVPRAAVPGLARREALGGAPEGDADACELRLGADQARTALLWTRAVHVDGRTHRLDFLLDISARKRMEEDLRAARLEAEAAARAQSSFLANMSHEVRTPLNGVMGISALLIEEDLPAGLRDSVRLIHTSGEMLRRVVDDILDFAKIEAGALAIESVPYAPRECLEFGVELFRAAAAAKGLTLELSVDPAVPQYVLGDETRVKQVFCNLLSNAVKFTAQGAIRGGASFEAGGDGAAPRLRVFLEDSGIGIAPEILQRLFRPFSQADPSNGRYYGGTGLGLAICRRLVELMGGAIGVTSEPGRGSRFEFTATAPEAAAPERLAADGRELGRAALQILVAEDNVINQQVTRRILEKLGHTAEIVDNGAEAVARALSRTYDLILMDVQMPGVSGLDATRAIRAGGAPYRATPVIALTASATLEDRQACLAAGMDDVVTKPLARNSLRQAIQRWGGVRRSAAPR